MRSDKLADDDARRGNELLDKQEFLGVIDPGIEKILAKLDDEPKGNIVEELEQDYEMDILLETRDIIYRHAKAKLEKGRRTSTGEASSNDTTQRARTKDVELESMRLVNRRVKARVIDDICQLMNFVSGQTEYFPFKITKKVKRVAQTDAETIKKYVGGKSTTNEDDQKSSDDSQGSDDDSENGATNDIVDDGDGASDLPKDTCVTSTTPERSRVNTPAAHTSANAKAVENTKESVITASGRCKECGQCTNRGSKVTRTFVIKWQTIDLAIKTAVQK